TSLRLAATRAHTSARRTGCVGSPKQNSASAALGRFRFLISIPGSSMWFRNLTLFRFSENTGKSLKSLETKLDKHRLRPCGPIELSTQGFISPFGRDEEALTHRVGDFVLVNLANEARLLPNSVVFDELAARLKKIAEKERRKVGSKERKRLKDEVLTD